ncbi:MAG TPA: hypothetical protein VLT83_17755 [Opitutaceae bacterium]|nr:hypothetical protein [Opitutaceae bacterium]
MPPLGIEFSGRFKRQARTLPTGRRAVVADALGALSIAFGQPHLHSGLGIRRLKGAYFEFRVDRDTRVVFKVEGSVASMLLVGCHGDVRRYLKNL